VERISIAVTFDIDMVDGPWGEFDDECGYFFRTITSEVSAAGIDRATVYVRIDDEIERVYGCSDYLLRKYSDAFDDLRNTGWEIGWHPHPFARIDNVARQNTDEGEVAAELLRHGPLAREAGMTSVRMGWGYVTTVLMEVLEQLGFSTENSAIPRPRYTWEQSVKDWSITPHHAYYPSILDYRIPGIKQRQIIELPMTVLPIRAAYDTEPVLRYISPSYWPKLFEDAIRAAELETLITVTHPHELAAWTKPRQLHSGNPALFGQNLRFLSAYFNGKQDAQWKTICDLGVACTNKLRSVWDSQIVDS
jgi:hypothetical protein